jgi:hypothetical protein
MKIFTLTAEQSLPRILREVFPFFADPRNLERITPPWLHFEILTAIAIEMRVGTLIDYRLRLHGIPIRWQSEITAWNPPHRFVDEQRRGPYSIWIHEHTFEAKGSETIVRDHVRYAVPGGRLVQKYLVAPDIEKIFAFRRKILEAIFQAVNESPQAG